MEFPNTKIKDGAVALNVSEGFLRQLIRQGRIPFYRLSPRTTRIDLQEVKSYMRLLATGKPADEISTKGVTTE